MTNTYLFDTMYPVLGKDDEGFRFGLSVPHKKIDVKNKMRLRSPSTVPNPMNDHSSGLTWRRYENRFYQFLNIFYDIAEPNISVITYNCAL